MDPADQLIRIGTALAAGLMIGLERGWTLREMGDGRRVAGIRTFALFGLVSGLAGLASLAGHLIVAGLIVGGSIAVIAIGYASSVRATGVPDATSAMAAIATVTLGFVAGQGQAALAVASAAVITAVLALRAELHGWVERLDGADIKAFARYAVISLAVFPFLPEGRYGPLDAWEPRVLWLVVVIITGFSFAGYVVNRLVGVRRGTLATAIIGGAYSSTAVTHSLAQAIGSGRGGGAENAGIAVASSVMYVRILLLTGLLANPLLIPVAKALLPAMLTSGAASYLLYRRSSHSAEPAETGNPIALLPAVSFAAFVAGTAVAARWAEGRFGEQGIAVLLLIMGSLDVDAAIVTAGGLKAGAISPDLAGIALAGTVLVNMAVKLGVTLAYGRRAARPAAFGLAASMAVLAASVAVGYAML